MIIYLTGFVCTLISNILIFAWMREIYGCKYRNPIIYVMACIVITAVGWGVSLQNIPLLNFFLAFGTINAISFLLFQRDNVKLHIMLSYNLIYILISLGADIISAYFMLILRGNSLYENLENQLYMIIMYAMNMAILIFLWRIFIIAFSKKKMKNIRLNEALLQAAYFAFSVFVFHSFAGSATSREDAVNAVIMIVGFVIIDFFIVHVLNNLSRLYQERYELESISRQNSMQLAHYVELDEKYEETRKLLHDIKKHFDIINTLKQDEKVYDYSQNLLDTVERIQSGFKCTNRILNVIINQKSKEAESKGINVELNVMDIMFEYIDDIDITGIFANLWDNAIEACQKCDDSARKIAVSILKSNGLDMIIFTNSYNGLVKKNNGKIISSKKSHDGLGLEIISNTVKKYDGTILITSDNDIFGIKIIFNR